MQIYMQWYYSGNWDIRKKCTLYKYLPYNIEVYILQYTTIKQYYIYSSVVDAAIKCKH
jgi:hypothetical protein